MVPPTTVGKMSPLPASPYQGTDDDFCLLCMFPVEGCSCEDEADPLDNLSDTGDVQKLMRVFGYK